MTDTVQPASPPPHRPHRPSSVLIRPWPKVIFFYPTAVMALLGWFYSLIQGGGAPATSGADATTGPVAVAAGVEGVGDLFLIVFFVNLLVFSFDFSRIKSITIVLGIIAVGLGLAWANTQWEVWSGLGSILDKIDVRMNTQFFGFTSAFFAIIYLMVLINTRFSYYEVNHREILHHHGYLGDITRVSTAGLQVNKEIYDLLEFLLLRSGRLIFYPASSRNAIVIDNVLGVNRIEARIKDLLSVIAVRELHDDHPDEND